MSDLATDQHFLDQVRRLTGTARLATEEAEQYAADITDPKLREEAQRLLDQA